MLRRFGNQRNYAIIIQTTRDNNAMHAKPDLRVVLEWMIAGSGSVIADVIWLLKIVNGLSENAAKAN